MGYRYNIIGDYNSLPTIYRINLGSKFYIWKGKSLRQSMETLSEDIDRLVRNGVAADHLLANVVLHVKRTRPSCTIEVLLQTDNLAELIEFERTTLINCKENKDFLNKNSEPYMPKWILEATGQPLPAVEHMDKVRKDEINTTENKAITDTFVAPDVSTHAKGEDIKSGPSESLADKARRIAATLEKIRSQKSQ
jgi:transcriptional regulator of met regulon